MKKSAMCLASVLLMLFLLILVALAISLNSELVNYFQAGNQVYLDEGNKAITDSTLAYLKGPSRDAVIEGLDEKELHHMQDVYSLFRIARIGSAILLLALASMLWLACRNGYGTSVNIIKETISKAGWAGLGLTGVIAVLSLNFGSSFQAFHLVFFMPGSYMFPADSTLIQLFPEPFFRDMFISMLALNAILFGIMAMAGRK